MTESLSQTLPAVEHKKPLLLSKATKRLLGVFITMSGFILPGCSRLDMDPSLNPDAYYAAVDPSVARAMDQVNQQAIEAAEAAWDQHHTAVSNQQEPIEAQEPQAPNISTNMLLCATVAPGGSISQAAQDANHGEFPPYDVGALSMLVSYFKDGEWKIAKLEDVMNTSPNESPNVNPGDTVCISPNADILAQQPTPSK